MGMTLKIGQRDGLSRLDIMQAKMLYKCDGLKPGKEKLFKKKRAKTRLNIKTNNH